MLCAKCWRTRSTKADPNAGIPQEGVFRRLETVVQRALARGGLAIDLALGDSVELLAGYFLLLDVNRSSTVSMSSENQPMARFPY